MNEQILPLISVIIPNYNRARLISQTIESVVNQTYTNWEAIIVDDGSTDDSVNLVKSYIQKDDRIKIFLRDREPKGAPTCRNIGLQKSSGAYVIFLDSDDLLAPFCMEQRVRFYSQNPEMDFLVFPILLFDSDINDLNILWNVDSEEDDLLRFLRIDALWQTTGPIYKREVLIRLQGFKEDLPFWQDFDLHLRCLLLELPYKKYMNVTPDMYHRRNFVDSISRTIPLIKDRAILEKRILFYFSLIEFVKERNINLKKEYEHTIWSVLFYFISSYLITHRDIQLFSKYLLKAKGILNIGFVSYCLSYFYTFLLALSKRISIMNKLSNLYFKIFKRYLPEFGMISNKSFGKKKWDGLPLFTSHV